MNKFATMWRRGFVIAASVALLASAVPAVTAQDDSGEVVVMTYFSKELGEGTLKELLADFEARVGIAVQFARCRPRGLQDRHPHPARRRQPAGRAHQLGRCPHRLPGRERRARPDRRDVGGQRSRQRRSAQASSTLPSTYDGAKYLLPLGYPHRADVLQPHGLRRSWRRAIPATWDELKAACETFNEAGVTPISLGSMSQWPAQFWFDYLILRTAGRRVSSAADGR